MDKDSVYNIIAVCNFTMIKDKKNVIIGGGVTGLYLAYRLCKRGNKVVLVEKEKDLGGLLACFDLNGVKLEKTYHHIFTSDKNIIKLIDELGLSKRLGWHKSSMSLFWNDYFWPFGEAVDLLKFRPIPLVDRLRTGVISLYLQKRGNWKKLENMTAETYMKKMIGRASYKVIWGPLLKSKFGKEYKNVSMAWLWARLNSRGGSKEAGVEKLGYMDGSFELLIKKLAEQIKDMGGEIITECTVNKVLNKGNKVDIEMNGKKMIFDRCFVTLANSDFGKLLNGKKYGSYIKKLKQIKYLGVVNLIFSSQQDLSDYYWNNINDTKSPFVAFVEQTKLVDKKVYSGQHVYFLGSYMDTKSDIFMASNDKIKSIYFNYLKKIVPSFDPNKVIDSRVYRFNKAQHVVDCNYRQKIMETKTQLKNVYLLNFSQVYPWDRGINWAIGSVDEFLKELTK